MSVSENGKAGKPGKDLTAVLPDGTAFEFWERENEYDRILYVSCDDPAASDDPESQFFVHISFPLG